jgi:hypothetical protein
VPESERSALTRVPNDRAYAERSEARRVGRREKELSGDSGKQTRHRVHAQSETQEECKQSRQVCALYGLHK